MSRIPRARVGFREIHTNLKVNIVMILLHILRKIRFPLFCSSFGFRVHVHLNMRVSLTLLIAPLIIFDASSARKTHTSILTIIPLPRTTVNVTHTGYPTATGTGFLNHTNYTLHKTLHYPTTTITRQSFLTVYLPLNVTNGTSFILNGSAPHTIAVRDWPAYNPFALYPLTPSPPIKDTIPTKEADGPCVINELYCDSEKSFSICAATSRGFTRMLSMGAVAEGTVCRDRSIVEVSGSGGQCEIGGALRCSEDGSIAFLCDEGMSAGSCWRQILIRQSRYFGAFG